MVLYDARRTADRSAPVMHLSYSDGLSTMSVFVERGRLDTGRLSSWHRGTMSGPVYLRADGLAERLVWDGDGSVYTVVADAPSDVVEDAVTGLPHGTVHRGVVSRVRHGLSRLGRWLDPFG
jgi:sigma-E factor negative regulatory protein RseB